MLPLGHYLSQVALQSIVNKVADVSRHIFSENFSLIFFLFILLFAFLDSLQSLSYCSMILAFCVVTLSALSFTDKLTSNARRHTSNPRKQEPICKGGNCQISYSFFLQEYTCISPKDIFETYLW